MWLTKSVVLEVRLVISLRKNEVERCSGLKKIKVEGEVDEGRQVIVRYQTATLKWKGFESYMVMWTKIHQRI